MARSLRILLLLAISPLALATEPTPASKPPARPVNGSPSATVQAAPEPAKATPADANAGASRNAGIDPNEDRRLRNMGYKPERQHGDIVYCRSELPVGSRFPQKTCMSAAQHGDLTRDGREALDRIQRNIGNNRAQ